MRSHEPDAVPHLRSDSSATLSSQTCCTATLNHRAQIAPPPAPRARPCAISAKLYPSFRLRGEIIKNIYVKTIINRSVIFSFNRFFIYIIPSRLKIGAFENLPSIRRYIQREYRKIWKCVEIIVNLTRYV